MSEISGVNKLIAERLVWLRTELFQMTQAELAEQLNVTHQHIISSYETGKFKPGVERCLTLINMAEKHGKKIDLTWLRPDIRGR